MECINGEWIMTGCAPDDPDRLKSLDELICLVRRIGFLPLFSNSIPGFSVEERVTAKQWWTEEEATDPWQWREILSDHPDITYGKFFNRSAGFVSKEWFPVFANYRRNGYDYDSLFEDDLASVKSKKIMDAFEMDDSCVGKSLLSSDLRSIAGKDESTLVQLQMQTYLVISGFRQRKNKRGEEYGWRLAVYETPETKWGQAYVTSSYSEDPGKSGERIFAQIKKYYPDSDDASIRKMLGIKWPGESIGPVKKKESKKPERKRIRAQELPWPENLITEIGLELVFPETKEYVNLSDDQMDGLSFVMRQLMERERVVLLLRYKEHKTLDVTASYFNITRERVRQIIAKAIRKLRHESRVPYYRDGYQATLDNREEMKEQILTKLGENMRKIPLYELKLTVRTCNCLSRAGYTTLGEVAAADPETIKNVRNLGAKSYSEIQGILHGYGLWEKPDDGVGHTSR